MITINASNPTIYGGFADESLPDARGLVDGSLFIVLQSAPPQVWIARNGIWTLQIPGQLSITVPLGGAPNSVSLPVTGGTTQRQIVALGGTQNATDPSYIDQMLIRIEDSLNSLLVEARLTNLQLQAVGIGQPITDDLDSLRMGLLDIAEQITR